MCIRDRSDADGARVAGVRTCASSYLDPTASQRTSVEPLGGASGSGASLSMARPADAPVSAALVSAPGRTPASHGGQLLVGLELDATDQADKRTGADAQQLTRSKPDDGDGAYADDAATRLASHGTAADATLRPPRDDSSSLPAGGESAVGGAAEGGQAAQAWGASSFLNFRRLPALAANAWAGLSRAGMADGGANKVWVAHDSGGFEAADAFDGWREGRVFKLGRRGLGYYAQAGSWEDAPTHFTPRGRERVELPAGGRELPNFRGGQTSGPLDHGLGINAGFASPQPAVLGPVAMGIYGHMAGGKHMTLGPLKEDLSVYRPVPMPDKPAPPSPAPKELQPRMTFGGTGKQKPAPPLPRPNPAAVAYRPPTNVQSKVTASLAGPQPRAGGQSARLGSTAGSARAASPKGAAASARADSPPPARPAALARATAARAQMPKKAPRGGR
mgnify:CR=1 FL=1